MKKKTLIFLSTLIAVFLSASESYAGIYPTKAECEPNCWAGTCGVGPGYYVCYYGDNSISGNVFTSPAYATLRGCQRVVQENKDDRWTIIRDCYPDGSYYRFQSYVNGSESPICSPNCSSCSSPSVCTTCNSGYYLSSGGCVACPLNATCNGSSAFICNSGYKKSGTACIKDTTVSSCPSRMKLSSDGCCCINK